MSKSTNYILVHKTFIKQIIAELSKQRQRDDKLDALIKAARELLDMLDKHATGSFGEAEDALRELTK